MAAALPLQVDIEVEQGVSVFGGPGATAVAVLLLLIIAVSLWRVFTRMGQPGWTGAVPIVNFVSIAALAGRPWWLGLLPIVPCIGLVAVVLLCRDLARMFGRGVLFTIGLVLLPFVFLPILAFSPREHYQGPTVRVFG